MRQLRRGERRASPAARWTTPRCSSPYSPSRASGWRALRRSLAHHAFPAVLEPRRPRRPVCWRMDLEPERDEKGHALEQTAHRLAAGDLSARTMKWCP